MIKSLSLYDDKWISLIKVDTRVSALTDLQLKIH